VIFVIWPFSKRKKEKPIQAGTVEAMPGYALETFVTEDGRGFYVKRLFDGQRLEWERLSRSEEGFESFQVAGTSHRLDALQHPDFAPGKFLSLVPEPKNPYDPNAVAVYNQDRSLHIGYVPKEQAEEISKELNTGQRIICFSMWETVKKKKRVALRALLVYKGSRREMGRGVDNLVTA
jgi:hypothetical protein